MKKFLLIIALVFISFPVCYGSSDEYRFIEKGTDAYLNNNDLEAAIDYFEKAYDVCLSEDSCASVKNLLVSSYNEQGNLYWVKEQAGKAREYYNKALKLNPKDFGTLLNIGTTYIMVEQDKAMQYFNKAKDVATTEEQITAVNAKIDATKKIIEGIDEMVKIIDGQSQSKTNDPYNYLQYYLDGLNVYEAWEKITGYFNYVTIAIIDDGIYINHPDLADSIRYNRSDTTYEIDGNGIDDDGNGYIDDYNGWNFVTNSKDMTPTGLHGTMVAGIIGARSNNGQGIAGIIPYGHIKLMPLIVFDSNGYTTKDKIIKAMEYAIDNGANVINLSLGGNQFEYSSDYDAVFKKAMKKNITIVVAAGNGDVLSNGINTWNSQLSPVCNGSVMDGNKIGVGALTNLGKPTNWSNYGWCVDTWAYGEDIVTTSIDSKDPYTVGDGTSFAAPMISAIIGLGYVQYGKLVPDIFNTALHSTFNTSNGKYVPNASAFLDNVGKVVSDLKLELQDAINWMYNNGLTKFNTPDSFMYSRGLRRDEAAKFFVQYAKLLGKTPDYHKKGCNFKDLNQAWDDLRDVVIESCQMGLFQGSNGKFMPSQKLTNAQAVTVFMRLKEGFKDESGRHFAVNYWASAVSKGLLNSTELYYETDFDNETTRGNVAIMLYRGRNNGN